MRSLAFLSLLAALIPATSPSSSATSSRMSRIRHVVTLCLENRSFDHMFAFLDHAGVDNLRDKPHLYNLVDVNDPNSARVYVGPGANWVAPQDPGHEIAAVTEQLFGQNLVLQPYPRPLMNGFLQNANKTFAGSVPAMKEVMKSFLPAEIPALTTLATEFAVFDRWYASVPGPTQPNRAFLHSATSNGEVDNQRWHMRLGYPQKTIYESLHDAGKDFAIYYHDGPTAGLFRWMRRPDILLDKMHSFDGTLGIGGFKKDVMNGKLPEYTFIDPRYFDRKGNILESTQFANDDHPPHDVRRGQTLVKTVYETLRNSPIWESTLLIITYDEHGGYYDHVPPPSDGVPNPDGIIGDGIRFDRLGIRVPTVMISPWIQRGLVVHEPPPAQQPTPTSQFEHSSIPAMVKKLFGLPDFLTKRDAWAGTFEHIWMQLDQPRQDCPTTIQDLPAASAALQRRAGPGYLAPDDTIVDEDGPLTDMQAALVEVVGGIRGDPMTEQQAMEVVGDDGVDLSVPRQPEMSKAEARAYVHQGMADIRSGL